MCNENFLSKKRQKFFHKLLIKTILDELDWHSVLRYFFYLINNMEDQYCDIQFISSSNEYIKFEQFFELLLSFLHQIFRNNFTKSYIPSLSSENEIDNMNFLIEKILRQIKMICFSFRTSPTSLE
jgi:hypothetical protein